MARLAVTGAIEGTMTRRIAMWSGPRNLSTAMMYAFAARGDCAVVDEPFYAAYLARTGLDHPMRDAVLASQSTDPAAVVASLLGSEAQDGAEGKPLFYQKLMTQHMIDAIPRDWLASCVNVFLIRHPARVVASYAKKREGPSLEDLGFLQQAALFDLVAEATGAAPIVIDSTDIRARPATMLRALCKALDIPFADTMLSWPAGPKPFDGVWAGHWYGAVHRSTGFEAMEGPLPTLASRYEPLVEAALPAYERLARYRLTPDTGLAEPNHT